MPIVKCSASKATPAKGIAYIMDPEKVIAKGSINFISEDPDRMAQQMLRTMHIHHKGLDPNERKYYHVKVAFDPRDRPENGGTLIAEKANDYAANYAVKTWPGREVTWAVQDHGASIHIHFIVAACDLETGKKLDARDAEYRAWKDQAQVLAEAYGLSTLDWRKATKEKRMREVQSDIPVEETFAEQGMKDRGRSTWKDDLRSIIDDAAASCCNLTEFRTALESQGVILTRCTEQTISYKMGDHKACRGDSLGGDYTALAIQSALQHNQTRRQEKTPAMQMSGDVDARIGAAAREMAAAALGGRVISSEEKNRYYEFGRLAGVTRVEVDTICTQAEKATWEEKQRVWAKCQDMKNRYWEQWRQKNQSVGDQLRSAYERRRMARKYEWLLDPRNRRSSLLGVLVASIYFKRHDSVSEIDREILLLKSQQARLREEAAAFKSKSDEAVAILRQKGLSLDEYTAAVQKLQTGAQKRAKLFQNMTPEERIQFCIDQVTRMRDLINGSFGRNSR